MPSIPSFVLSRVAFPKFESLKFEHFIHMRASMPVFLGRTFHPRNPNIFCLHNFINSILSFFFLGFDFCLASDDEGGVLLSRPDKDIRHGAWILENCGLPCWRRRAMVRPLEIAIQALEDRTVVLAFLVDFSSLFDDHPTLKTKPSTAVAASSS